MAAIFGIIRTFEMTKNLDEFFIPDNEVRLPDELDYSRVDEYIRSAEAFSRSSYQIVYIIDYKSCILDKHGIAQFL